MAKTTLQVIQAIEEEAKKIKLIYDERIETSSEQMKHKLAEEETTYNDETEQILSELQQQQQEELALAEEQLERSIEKNQAKSEQALTDKKTELVQQIVKEVVMRYGN